MSDINRAIELIRAGDKKAGGQMLVKILKADQGNVQAWLWLAQAVPTVEKQRQCLKKVLELEPDHKQAKMALARIERRTAPAWIKGRALAFLAGLVLCGLLCVVASLGAIVNQSQEPAAVAEAGPISQFPGLELDRLLARFQNLDCPEIPAWNSEAGYFVSTCRLTETSYSMEISIYGDGPRSVDYISATMLDYSNRPETVVEFLGFVAAMPFEGAEPDQARQWVEANIGNESAEAVFGGLPYSLSGDAAGKTLAMGEFRW